MILSNLFLAFGPGQIALIVVVALLFFGGKKIPELMKGLGTGIKEFKKGVKEEDTIEESIILFKLIIRGFLHFSFYFCYKLNLFL